MRVIPRHLRGKLGRLNLAKLWRRSRTFGRTLLYFHRRTRLHLLHELSMVADTLFSADQAGGSFRFYGRCE